tara:strand:+ start:329 stop:577 length:249 start_codon:yes stop_codon:yes gene_type:complete
VYYALYTNINSCKEKLTMSKINTYLLDLEQKGELQYDEVTRRYFKVGQQHSTSSRQEGSRRETTEGYEGNNAENGDRSKLSH